MPGTQSANPDSDVTSHLGGRYDMGSELGRGGWGSVVRAHDRQLDRDVAVKRIHSELAEKKAIRDRFVSEARVTASLQHPGVAPVHELGVGRDGAPFYVMKLLEGPTLGEAIREAHHGSNPAAAGCSFELLERFIDVCNTIACAHQQRIIHRDLKPSNILVGRFGETVVVDWGLANRLDTAVPEPSASSVEATLAPGSAVPPSSPARRSHSTTRRNATGNSATRHGSVLGTPAYMSPEQSRGEVDSLSEATDIYALGVILYEVLTGENPFRSDDVETTLTRVREGDYRSPGSVKGRVPSQLAAICTTAMARVASDRYPTAEAIVADVRRYLAGERVSVCPDSLWAKLERWRRRRPALAAGVAASLSVLTVASLGFSVVIAQAHEAERAARLAAEAAKRDALERLADARRAGDAWLIDLSGALEFFPGMNGLREDLLGRATEHYSALATGLDRDDPNERLESARCQVRLGDLHRLMDRPVEARSAYTQATESLETLGTNEAAQLEHVNARIGLALLGDRIDFREESAWLRSQTASDAKGATVRLAIARVRSGDLKGSSAVESLTEAESVAAELLQGSDEPRDHQRLQTVRDELTRRLRDAGRLKEASRVWRAELKRLGSQIGSQPDRPDLLQARAFARLRLAGLDSRRRHHAEANRGYQDAITDLRAAWRLSDADAYYHRNVAISLANLGRGAGDPDLAGLHLDEAIEQLRHAVAVEGPSASDLTRLAECETALGDLAARSRDPETLTHYDAAEQCFVVLEDHDELNTARWTLRAKAWIGRAAHQLDLGDTLNATIDLDHAEKLLNRAPRRKALEARLHALRSECHRVDGDETGAMRAEQANCLLLRELAEEEKESASDAYPAAMLAFIDHLIQRPTPTAEELTEATHWLSEMRRRCPDCNRTVDWLQRSALLHWTKGASDLALRAAEQTLAIRSDDPLAQLVAASAEEGPEAAQKLGLDFLASTPGDRRLRFWVNLFAGP